MFRGVVCDVCRLSVLCHASALSKIASRIEMPFGVETGVDHTSNVYILRGGPEPVEGPRVLPAAVGEPHVCYRGLMLGMGKICVRVQMYHDGCCSVTIYTKKGRQKIEGPIVVVRRGLI